jgi:hypothetical protein
VENSSGRNAENRKQAISIRMSRSDVRHVKRLAERLGARDSDVIRFAVKLMLGRLAPLQDPMVRGGSLVPVFLESGPDLMRHFDLDAAKLFAIINDGVDEARRVDVDDVHLIAMSGIQRSYFKLQIPGMRKPQESGGAVNSGQLKSGARPGAEDSLDEALRQYLYEKYLFRKAPAVTANQGHAA